MSVRRINSGDSRVPCDTWNWNVTLRSLLHHFNFYSISQITKIQIAAKTKSLAASAVRTLNSLASHVTRSKRIAFFFFGFHSKHFRTNWQRWQPFDSKNNRPTLGAKSSNLKSFFFFLRKRLTTRDAIWWRITTSLPKSSNFSRFFLKIWKWKMKMKFSSRRTCGLPQGGISGMRPHLKKKKKKKIGNCGETFRFHWKWPTRHRNHL